MSISEDMIFKVYEVGEVVKTMLISDGIVVNGAKLLFTTEHKLSEDTYNVRWIEGWLLADGHYMKCHVSALRNFWNKKIKKIKHRSGSKHITLDQMLESFGMNDDLPEPYYSQWRALLKTW